MMFPLGADVCLWGGYLFDNAGRWRAPSVGVVAVEQHENAGRWSGGGLHGGACLDLAALEWEWLRGDAAPRDMKCEWVGHADPDTAVVSCRRREHHTLPSNWEHPEREVWGGESWSLWRVRRSTSASK
jgi:hypothetical protein